MGNIPLTTTTKIFPKALRCKLEAYCNTKGRRIAIQMGAVPRYRWDEYRQYLAHQNRTIAIASDFRVDGAKSPEIPQKEGVLGSEIAARNRKSLATFHRTLKSQCSIAFSCLGNRAISGVRDGHRNRKSQKSLRFRCAWEGWGRKTNKHKQIRGIVPEWVGVTLFMCFFFSWGKRETHEQNSEEISQEKAGRVPGQSRDNPGTIP